MEPQKKKDNLTDLVGMESEEVDSGQSQGSEGQVTTTDGEVVTLDLKRMARRLLNVVKKKK